ncbi:unnamed protein product, partial [Brenthis ino]
MSLFIKIASCIHCFKCEEEAIDGSLLCKHFDGGDKFLVDCVHSTMCFKRETTHTFGDEMSSVTIVQRGCAPQTLNGDQAKINGKWRPVNTTYEVYEEACKEDVSELRVAKIINCYCRGHLCNNSKAVLIGTYEAKKEIVSLKLSPSHIICYETCECEF